ncbi:hypothetical protein FRC07_009280 [Ceratobasidium sp. 392]|nr:hypothetical protein FRC07_009280 [Ceratobasidium sp. 392]
MAPITQHQARQQLQSVRMRLSDVTKDYHDACRLLEATCAEHSLVVQPQPSELEQTLLAVETEILEFSHNHLVMRGSWNILKGLQNQFKAATHVNSLPSEILSRIFSEAICHCTRVHYIEDVLPVLSPVIISAVCRRWRKIAISQQSLWTHIDLKASSRDFDYGYHSPTLWLDRARGASMFIHIRNHYSFSYTDRHEDEGSSTDHDEDEPAPTLRKLLGFLKPLMPLVSSLDVDFPWPLDYAFYLVFKCWRSHGTTGRAKSLSIQSSPNYSPLEPILPTSSAKIFNSLESLRLYNTILPISDLLLSNLTDLQLRADDSCWDMSQSELADILASCPKLQLLSVDGLAVGASDRDQDSEASADSSDDSDVERQKPSAVALRDLLVLDIGASTSVESTARILEVIDPGPNIESMGLPLFDRRTSSTAHPFSVIDSFFDRHRPKTVHVYGSLNLPSFATRINAWPHVETLVLHQCHVSKLADIYQTGPGTTSITINTNPDSFKFGRVFWPKLESIHFYHCYLSIVEVSALASSHSVQSLSIWDCYNADKSGRKKRIDTQSSRDYVRQLSGVVPRVVFCQDVSNDSPLFSRYTQLVSDG